MMLWVFDMVRTVSEVRMSNPTERLMPSSTLYLTSYVRVRDLALVASRRRLEQRLDEVF